MKSFNPLEIIAPPYRKLWDRSGQNGEVQVEGSEIALPFFELSILKVDFISSQSFDSNEGVSAGEALTYSFELSDGSSRIVRAWIPFDRSEHLVATSGTAFMTTIDGYAGDRSRRIASEAGLAVIQVGAEYSGDSVRSVTTPVRLAKAVMSAPAISLAKTAQAEELIIAEMCERHNLPRNQVAHGDSRDSVTTLAQPAYASLHDMNVAYIDPKALVMHDQLSSVVDIAKVLRWLGREAVVGSTVLMQLATENDLLRLSGTPTRDLRELTGLFVGTLPALFSGEAGVLAQSMPLDIRGYANLYRKDILCNVETWEETLRRYPNLYVNIVNKAVHAHLASITAGEKQLGRFTELREQTDIHGLNYDATDLSYMKKKMANEHPDLSRLTMAASA